ncbi:MAG: DUF2158 domain-containing protein [Flavobacteriales bacterium]|nr:DUF2158 domain-containing protein [Flavobacteriales bacterium]
MKRIFKPGDRVQLRGGGPVMIVQRYAKDYNVWLGWYESDVIVECTWLDGKRYHREKYHQNFLVKLPSRDIFYHNKKGVSQRKELKRQ